jgi:hypothetical protein
VEETTEDGLVMVRPGRFELPTLWFEGTGLENLRPYRPLPKRQSASEIRSSVAMSWATISIANKKVTATVQDNYLKAISGEDLS